MNGRNSFVIIWVYIRRNEMIVMNDYDDIDYCCSFFSSQHWFLVLPFPGLISMPLSNTLSPLAIIVNYRTVVNVVLFVCYRLSSGMLLIAPLFKTLHLLLRRSRNLSLIWRVRWVVSHRLVEMKSWRSIWWRQLWNLVWNGKYEYDECDECDGNKQSVNISITTTLCNI